MPPDSDDLYTIPNKQDHLFWDLNVIQQQQSINSELYTLPDK